MAYEDIFYPASVDFFEQVSNGSGPSNKVLARQINKVQNGIVAVEKHTQFTPVTVNATGSMIYITTVYHKLTQTLDDPGFRLVVPVTIDSSVANQWFEGNPFNRKWAIFASSIAYRIVGGARRYKMHRTGVNIPQENGSLTCRVNAVLAAGETKWSKDDVCEVTVMLVNPGILECPQAEVPAATGCGSDCANYSNKVVHYMADGIGFPYSDGDDVTQWGDCSGNNRTADDLSVFTPNFPTYHTFVQNNLPVVRCTATGNSGEEPGLEIPFGAISPPVSGNGWTIYWVGDYNINQAGVGPIVIPYEDGEFIREWRIAADMPAGFLGPSDPPNASVAIETIEGSNFKYVTANAQSGKQVLAFVVNGDTGVGQIYYNGLLLTNTHNDGVWTGTYTLGHDFVELFSVAGNQTLQGDHYELIIFNEAHDSVRVNQITNCMLVKWQFGIEEA